MAPGETSNVRLGFAEKDAIGATVKKGDLTQNVPRLPNESVDELIERAVASVPPGGVVSAWLYVDSRPRVSRPARDST
jgi:hypothetical protein